MSGEAHGDWTDEVRDTARPSRRTVVVIGGGIAGLASAALLAREGCSVDLVEARGELGGRAGVIEQEGFRFDTGPSWYLMPEVFDHFFRLLGTSAEAELSLQRLDPAYRVFFEGESGARPADAVDIRADRAANVALFEELEPGAGRALERYLESAAHTFDMAIEHFLYTSFSSLRPFLSRPLLGRIHRLGPLLLQSLERFVSRRFADRRIRQILGYPAVFLGSSPDRTPSMYHLMSALDLTGGVLYPQGGFGALIDAIVRLARESGVRFHTDTAATAVLTDPLEGAAASADREPGARRAPRRGRDRMGRRPQARATGVRVRRADGTEDDMPADVVVAAADLHHVETCLLPPALQTYPESWWARRTSGPGGVLVMLGVRGGLPQLAHHSLLFTRDWSANFSAIRSGTVPDPASVYVCRTSATDPGAAPEGMENLFVLIPMPADPALGRGGVGGTGAPAVEAIADRAIEQIARWAEIPDLAERIVTRRTVGPTDFAEDLRSWRGGILGPEHTLSQSAVFRAGNTSKRVEGLHYAGSSTIPGIGLPMCLISAEILVKRLRGDTGMSPLPEPQSSPPSEPQSSPPRSGRVGSPVPPDDDDAATDDVRTPVGERR
ncbi:phytoene desaturase [Brevibacterium sanguinis]|uniref:Phytoene desaturase n=2 Tax=Brevibacterium TaxID=1696 RepID=A0A366IGJ8_9MICO|nr:MULTISPECIES: phytoene desaturase family protein [Brevibacterium]RBP62191.1 phytoene desaturase [Brevibacterium sanguinis]RBP70677.1 phytoene desaturase [Brevibacterium celere]